MDTRQWQNPSMRGLWSVSPKPSTCSQNRCQTHRRFTERNPFFWTRCLLWQEHPNALWRLYLWTFSFSSPVFILSDFFRLCCTRARRRPTCSSVTSSQQQPVVNGPLSWSLVPSVDVWPSSTISRSVSPKRWSGRDVKIKFDSRSGNFNRES